MGTDFISLLVRSVYFRPLYTHLLYESFVMPVMLFCHISGHLVSKILFSLFNNNTYAGMTMKP